jgi:hypothetical protein
MLDRRETYADVLAPLQRVIRGSAHVLPGAMHQFSS